jgi:hypothetical protein
MAFQNRWLVEDRVVLVEFSGDITLDELMANDADMLRYVNSGTPPVHIICKLQGAKRFPTNISNISRSAKQYLTSPNIGWFLIVGVDNPLLTFIGSIVAQVSQLKFKQAADLDEALQVLGRMDFSLAPYAAEMAQRGKSTGKT